MKRDSERESRSERAKEGDKEREREREKERERDNFVSTDTDACMHPQRRCVRAGVARALTS